jgi:hypothetical protein
MPRGMYDRSKMKKTAEPKAPKAEPAPKAPKTPKAPKAPRAQKAAPRANANDLGAKTSFLLENIQTLAGVVVEGLKTVGVMPGPTVIDIKMASKELNTQIGLLIELRKSIFGEPTVEVVAPAPTAGLPAMAVPPGHPAIHS